MQLAQYQRNADVTMVQNPFTGVELIIRYHSAPRMDQHFHVLMNTYDYEDWLFRIDSNLKDFRNLKEEYVLFNLRNGGNPIVARTEIDELIVVYKKSSYEMFRDFANLLEKYKGPILQPF